MVKGNIKIWNVLSFAKSLYAHLRWFCLCWKMVRVRNEKQKQMCWIKCDVANIYQLFLLPKRRRRRSWSRHLSRYSPNAWQHGWQQQQQVCVKRRGDRSIPESHPKNIPAIVDGKQPQNTTVFCFRYATFIFSTVYSVAFTLTSWPNHTLQPSLFAHPVAGNAPYLHFHLVSFQQFA